MGLDPPPRSIDTSVVTRTVTVRHAVSISPETIKTALDDAGFDIVSTPTDALSETSNARGIIKPIISPKRAKHLQQCVQCQAEHSQNLSNLKRDAMVPPVMADTGAMQIVLSIGGMTCASCTSTITDALQALSGVSDVAVNLLGNSATAIIDKNQRAETLVETIEDAGYEATIVRIEPILPLAAPKAKIYTTQMRSFRVILSVGGMTCASCVTTITDILTDIAGVSEAAVNLLGNSASALVTDEKVAALAVEAIEDAGYEAKIVTLEPIDSHAEDDSASLPRTVTLHIHGMSCQ